MTGHRQLATATQRKTVNSSNHNLVSVFDGVHYIMTICAHASGLFDVKMCKLRNISTRSKGFFTHASKNHTMHVVVGLRLINSMLDFTQCFNG